MPDQDQMQDELQAKMQAYAHPWSRAMRMAFRMRDRVLLPPMRFGICGAIENATTGNRMAVLDLKALTTEEAFAVGAIWMAAGDACSYIDRLANLLKGAEAAMVAVLDEQGDEMPIDKISRLRQAITAELQMLKAEREASL